MHLLVRCGANVNRLNRQKNSPLHVLLENPIEPDVFPILDLFSSQNVDSDLINSHGKTPQQFIPTDRPNLFRHFQEKLGIRRLKCLCAHVILHEKLSYQSSVPETLVRFLQNH